MGNSRHRGIYLVLFILYIGAVSWLCFGRFESDMDIPRRIFGIETDKIVHFAIFFPYVFLAHGAFFRKNYWKTFTLAVIAATVTAFAMELLQGAVTSHRYTDPWDLVINISAITAASLILAVAALLKRR